MAGTISYPRTEGSGKLKRDLYSLEKLLDVGCRIEDLMAIANRIGWSNLPPHIRARLRALLDRREEEQARQTKQSIFIADRNNRRLPLNGDTETRTQTQEDGYWRHLRFQLDKLDVYQLNFFPAGEDEHKIDGNSSKEPHYDGLITGKLGVGLDIDGTVDRDLQLTPSQLDNTLHSEPIPHELVVREASATDPKNAIEVGGESTVTRTVGNNTVTYTMDANGNTLSASGNLREYFSGGVRSTTEIQAQADAAAKGITGDQGGHLVGYRFLPEQGAINLFPQEGNFNMSAFKTIENDYARYIDQGYQVNFNHTLSDFSSIGRPGSLSVTFSAVDIQGNIVDSWVGQFQNQAGQIYVRRVP